MREKLVRFLSRLKTRFLIFLMIIGPGIVTAVADNDAGGVATYTVAASLYGLASRWLILPEAFLLAFTQEVGSRIAIITQKGLGDLIRETFGIKISVLIFLAYFLVNQMVVLQNVAGLKASLQLFHFPWQISLVAVASLLILFVIKFNYKRLQRIFLLMIGFYFTYVLSALLSNPDWEKVFQEVFLFPKEIKIDISYIFSRMAVLGTTITAWGQFFVHSYIVDKNLNEEHLKYERLEIYLGSLLTSFFSLMIAISVSQTLFSHKIIAKDVFSAGLAIKPLVGVLAFGLFAAGLMGASILGLTIVPLATAYVFAEIFGYEGSLDADFKTGKLFYIFFSLQIIIAMIITLFPKINLFNFTLYADFLNGAMLPLIFYLLIRFSEDKEIMGEKTAGRFTRITLRFFSIIITSAILVSIIGKLLKLY